MGQIPIVLAGRRATRWNCLTCGAPLPEAALFCPRCGAVTPVNLTIEQERYARGNVRVTNRRLVLGGRTIPLAGIITAQVATRENHKNHSVSTMLAGAMLVLLDITSGNWHRGARLLGLFGLIGALLVLQGLWVALTHRRWYELVVRTSMGLQSLVFDDAGTANEVARAIRFAVADHHAGGASVT